MATAKKKIKYRYRSSITGRRVTKGFAEENPEITEREQINPKKRSKKK